MNLDWKWIGFGLLIMLGLSILASIIMGVVIGADVAQQLEEGIDPSEVTLSNGELIAAALLNFLAFVIGGFIVGVKSAGRTIVEPAIAAAIAVALALVLSGSFTIGGLLAGGLVPFLAGLLGGWLGEKRQDARAGTN